jgi:hypothetical protein
VQQGLSQQSQSTTGLSQVDTGREPG